MAANPWDRLVALHTDAPREPWLPRVLEQNSQTAYLRHYGSPTTAAEFRARVPIVRYEDLQPWLERMKDGEPDVLFAGRPVAYERTGGSTGGSKLVPYSAEGLGDFQRAVLPWLINTVRAYGIAGRAYLALSPATRAPETIRGVPVGLPDGAYLGAEAAGVLAEVSAVPPGVALIPDVARWRAETLKHLTAAGDLELVSVWSPTFLLRLLDDVPDPVASWPRLKVLSCWASGESRAFADALAARLPHAHLQPKGLLSTECAITVPGSDDRPVLNPYGFFEFECDGQIHLCDELAVGQTYEVIATTASGLYRYRTGDLVRCESLAGPYAPVLEFIGRGSLASDLVGEKLVEPFVAHCLADVPGFRFLAPEAEGRGYVLVTEAGTPVNLAMVEHRLCGNPQYAYARKLGQLRGVRHVEIRNLFDRYAGTQLSRGTRLGDVKPVALRSERTWIEALG